MNDFILPIGSEARISSSPEPKPANPFTLLSAFESLVHRMNGAPVRHSYGGPSRSIVISDQHRQWFNEILKDAQTLSPEDVQTSLKAYSHLRIMEKHINWLESELQKVRKESNEFTFVSPTGITVTIDRETAQRRYSEHLVEIRGLRAGSTPHVGDYVAGVVRPIKILPGNTQYPSAPKFPIGTEVIDWRSPVTVVRKVTKHEFREGKWWYSRLENGACIFPEDDLRPARPSVIQSIEEAVNRVETKNAREQKFQIGTLVLEPILRQPREITEARFWPSENVWMYRLANRFGWYAESTLKEAK